MKFLVAFSCLLAIAVAKPGLVGSPLIAPTAYGYSNIVSGHVAASPLAYSAFGAPLAHAVATPVAHSVAAVAPLAAIEKTQYHAQDEVGQASYGHAEAFQTHNAVQDAAGNKIGSYSYVAPDGQVIATNYVADALGYRVASNALPVGPAVVPVGPVDTPEVVAARIAHLHEHAVVKSRARRGVAIAPLGVAYSAPLVHHAAIPVAAASPVLRAATLTTIVNTPGHAVSYRVD